ncbi:hypothetical protein GcM1_144007 [Golovinomyces cichoracearum]|uniref:Uncharacterized protein n=1 Tax=Golovinomyces cichoracearum TaxID=62708 RepID=A0A420JBF2_9PEZI|nr:hypothetical protein GcM1_144007 [Golovinomyces cichoracearum]
MLVLSISQEMRGETDSYDLESLFSNLIDESKRLGSLDHSGDTALLVSLRGKFGKHPKSKGITNYRIQKNKFCKNCRTTSHQTSDCYILYPQKSPKGWRHPSRALVYSSKARNQEQLSKSQASKSDHDETNEVLLNQVPENSMDFDIAYDLNVEEVYVTTHLTNTSAEYLLGIENKISSLPRNDEIPFRFVLDTAATSHIIGDKSYFAAYRSCRKIVR